MTFRVTLLITFFLSCLPITVQAQQDFFPFIGKVTASKVNVRAGQSENFESVCQLKRDHEVFVIGRNYNWYKIKLPKFAKVYISGEYIYLLNEKTGGVIGDRVNIRAGAGDKFSVIGQALAGEEVRILEKGEIWYWIQPPDDTYGWIHEDYVAFKSKDVDSFRHKYPVREVKNPVIEAQEIKNNSDAALDKLEDLTEDKNVFVSGYLKPVLNIEGISYSLNVNGETLYFLNGMKSMLEDFLHQKVDVDGAVDLDLKDQFEYPVLNVTKIQLIL